MQPRYRPGMYGNTSSAYVPTHDIEGYRGGGLLGNGPRSMPGGVQQMGAQRPMVHQPPPGGQMGGYDGSGINPGAGRPDIQAGMPQGMRPPMVHQRPPQGMPYMPGGPSNQPVNGGQSWGGQMPGSPNMPGGMQPNIGMPQRQMAQQDPYQMMGGPSATFGRRFGQF